MQGSQISTGSARTPTGRREQNKAAKRERIRAAARDLFDRNGYDATTMRAIATQAEVGLGTLFSYADDKRDLIFLITNANLAELAEQGFQAARPLSSLLDQLVAVFAVHYEWFAKSPTIARIALRELTFYTTGKQSAEFHAVRARLFAGIETILAAQQRAGNIRAELNISIAAQSVVFMYTSAVRWWIAKPTPKHDDGVRDLRELLALQIEGLRPRPPV